MGTDDVLAHMLKANPQKDPLPGRSEVAAAVWKLGVATAVLVLVMFALIGMLFFLRYRDTRDQLEAQSDQIAYLCRTTTVIDVLIVQEKALLLLQLQTDKKLGVNERERIRSRISTLEVFHAELSDQQPCEEVQ